MSGIIHSYTKFTLMGVLKFINPRQRHVILSIHQFLFLNFPNIAIDDASRTFELGQCKCRIFGYSHDDAPAAELICSMTFGDPHTHVSITIWCIAFCAGLKMSHKFASNIVALCIRKWDCRVRSSVGINHLHCKIHELVCSTVYCVGTRWVDVHAVVDVIRQTLILWCWYMCADHKTPCCMTAAAGETLVKFDQ